MTSRTSSTAGTPRSGAEHMATTITAGELSSTRPRAGWLPDTAIQYLLWLGTVVLVVAPLAPIVWASLWTTPLYEDGGALTLTNYRDLLSDSAWWTAVRNSVAFAFLTTVGAMLIGTSLAVLCTRTNLPGRRVFGTVILLPVALPGLVLILGWSAMWAPFGYAKAWLEQHTPFPVPIDIYSVPGMALVATSVAAPVIFLYVRGTLASLDSSLEDAARSAGASPLRALWSVTIPMLRPALLNSGMIVFALALEVLGLPLILGTSSNVAMVSTYLYDNWVNATPPRQGLVSAGAILLLMTVTLLLILRNRLVGDVARFTTTTGKPTAAGRIELGPVRWLLGSVVAIWLFATLVIPVIGVVLTASTEVLTPFISPWSVLTGDNFQSVMDNPVYTRSIRNSLLIATVGGFLGTLAVAGISVVAHRSGFRHRRSLQHFVLYPRAMPGLVTGMAFFWSFAVLDPSGKLLSSLWAIGIAFTVRSLALGYSAFFPALAALGEDLDRAARTSGASWWVAMRSIVFRLLRPAMGVSFVLLFVSMLNDADPAVFMATSDTQVVGLTMLQLSLTGVAGPVAALGVIQIILTFTVLGIGRTLFGVKPRV